mmetsp:Transcript_42325/g.99299  ORF Transcript_42325/g.99299 Transcript_42325/m.99299 type:complete len:216 (-) Transcript_42325:679-1326(-)
MVAALAQLHGQIVETGTVDGLPAPLVQKLIVFFVQGPIVLFLHGGELNFDDGLFLGWHGSFDVFLEPSQHVGSNGGVQFVDAFFVGHVSVPFDEGLHLWKPFGVDDVQQRPQFGHVVLDGCSGEQHAVCEIEGGAEGLRELAGVVFESMGFVHHQHLPLHAGQFGVIVHHAELRSGDDDVDLPASFVLGEVSVTSTEVLAFAAHLVLGVGELIVS